MIQSNASAWVYTPPGYGASDRRYPVVYFFHGYWAGLTHGGTGSLGGRHFQKLVDQLFRDPTVNPAIVVLVDAWTSLGGSQYLNSPGTGRYLDYLAEDVVSAVDSRYRTIADRDHRALSGKSSGGYGAMVATMLRPDVFGAFATHAGDCAFEMSYFMDIAGAARSTSRSLRLFVRALLRGLSVTTSSFPRPDRAGSSPDQHLRDGCLLLG